MKRSEMIFGMLRIPLDMLALTAALLLSYELRRQNIDLLPGLQLLEPATTLPLLPYYFSGFVVPSVLLFIVLAAIFRLYNLRSTLSAWVEVGRVIMVTLLWAAIITAWFFFIIKELFFSRALFLHSIVFIVIFDTAVRSSLVLLQRSLLRNGVDRMLVVSLGSQPLVPHAKETLTSDIHYYYLGHLPSLDALKRIIYQRNIDTVIHTDPNPRSDETLALIDYCRSHHIGYGFLPPVLADVPHLLRVEELGLLPLIRFQPTPLDGWGRVAKRIFDLVVSLALLIILSPLFLVIAIGILIDSGFPVFYVSTRVGEHGRKKISIWKFRSMVKEADAMKDQLQTYNFRNDGPLFKMRNDPRVTRWGCFLRRYTLDELPQLINVFFGHMSLVGPRPHLPQEVDRYSLEQRRVFAVKPGMTGLAQTSGRSNLSFGEEVRLDLRYIEEWSLVTDLWILWRTVFVVLSRRGAD